MSYRFASKLFIYRSISYIPTGGRSNIRPMIGREFSSVFTSGSTKTDASVFVNQIPSVRPADNRRYANEVEEEEEDFDVEPFSQGSLRNESVFGSPSYARNGVIRRGVRSSPHRDGDELERGLAMLRTGDVTRGVSDQENNQERGKKMNKKTLEGPSCNDGASSSPMSTDGSGRGASRTDWTSKLLTVEEQQQEQEDEDDNEQCQMNDVESHEDDTVRKDVWKKRRSWTERKVRRVEIVRSSTKITSISDFHASGHLDGSETPVFTCKDLTSFAGCWNSVCILLKLVREPS